MRQIGKYHVQEKIGVGGFGEVFKGFDPYIKRAVAIKTCSTHNDEIRSRFFQEAEIAGNLNHKNITTIHDFGVEGELPYLVQEYLSGEDLDNKVKRRDPLPYAEKLVYLIQIARGLAHAHENGVIHRDIKPANVRILEDGSAKIMDFGIAKLAQQESGLTQTGMTLGTAAYLSPEQIRGQSVDARTDIFSFGVLAYELMTYRRPFDGTQISAVLYQLLHHEPPPMQEIWPEAPPGVAAVVACCLQKDPQHRYEHAGALLHALERLSTSGREAARPSDPPPPGPKPAQSPGQGSPPRQAQPAPAFDASPLERSPSDQPASLDNIEISTTLVAAPDEAAIQAYGAAKKRNPWPLIGAALALILVAGVGGWWFGNKGENTDGTSVAGAVDSEDGELGTETEDVQPATPETREPEETKSADGEAENAADAADEEPVKLDPGTILVAPPGWTQEMTVSLGRGVARPLDRQRSFNLKPGTYRLHFEIDEDGYTQTSSLSVAIGEGAKKSVSSPIPQPGGLSVRPQLNRPQGEVLVDGLPRGSSPLRRLLLAPGTYSVEVRPRGGGDGITQQVALSPGTLSVLTFDLEAGTLKRTDKPLAGS